MSTRVFTGITFALSFNARDTPPATIATFTNVDDAGRETHGQITLRDSDGQEAWDTANGFALLDLLNKKVDAEEKTLSVPGTLAALVASADAAKRTLLESATMRDAIEVKRAVAQKDLDDSLAAKLAAQKELDALNAEIASKRAPA